MASDLTLSLMIGTTSVAPVPRSVMEALTEVSVRIGSGGSQPSGFELKFATSKASVITTRLLPSGYFDPPHRVVIAATLRGQTTVLMDGVITQQDVVPSDEAGKSVLSIKGEDLTRMLDLIDLSGFPFPALPAEARVLLMVAKYTPVYKILPLVVPSILIDIEDPLDNIPAQSGTDLTYINLLADRVGYTFYLQPGPLPGESVAYWGPKLHVAIPFLPTPTPFAIDWDGRSNVESLQFSFDGFKKTQFVVLIKLDDVPVPIPIPVPDITPLSPPLGRKSPLPLKISPLTGLAGYTPIEAAAIALAKASDAANVISGSGSLDVLRYGSILSARTIVKVKGAGITYDGDYFVDTVTHTIKPGSYKQSFTLLRNALIAGSGSIFDALSFGLSVPQQLAGFASSAADSASQPLPGLPGLGDLPIPAPAIPVPRLPGPGLAAPPGAAPGAGPPVARSPAVSLAPSMPASPTP
jgi:hypothetical protein